ncbi:MAG: hypothetical protein GF364_10870 [Candidatus Lokiarchaeota archaeon]|nr:hypothetical protein [Candidatus Lokiarchaeota archaeon]
MQSFIHDVDRKPFLIAFFVQIAIYTAWLIYIFGVLGHVCPVAWVGVWCSSLSGCVAFSDKRPRFLGTFLSFIVTALLWGVAYFYLHPNDTFGWEVDTLSKVVTVGPFISYIATIFLTLLIQIVFTKTEKIQGPEKVSRKIGLIFERILAGLSFLLTIVVGVVYVTVPWVKEELWDDDPSEYLDTVFPPGGVYQLFYVLAIIAIISGIFMGFNAYIKNKGNNLELNITTRLIGYTFLGFIAIGTIAIFIYLGTPSERDKNEIE